MARRRVYIRPLVALLAALLLGALMTNGAAGQTGTERVSATPAEGTYQTRFHFVGAGFPTGRTVVVRIMTPDNVERRLLDDNVELVWQPRPDGTFEVDLTPAERFFFAPPGRWRALFCSFGAPTCQLVEFDVRR